MSHLHRFYAANAPAVWELEGRWMREAGTFRPPSAVQWIATRACDLTCAHCYSEAGPRHPDELDTAEALALVDTIAAMGCDQLVIAGGEPLLRKDLDVVVARAAERGLRWALHTHGALVPEREALFSAHPPAMVAVSLDGPPDVHDRLRGRSGSYAEALRALRFLVDETPCPVVVAGTVVNRLNADLLTDMEPAVRASGATSWGLHLFAPEGRGAAHTALFPTPGQLRRAAAFARRMRASLHVELDNEWGSAGPHDVFYRDHAFLCGAGRFTCVVGVEGSVFPCTTTDPAEAEGNVRTDDLAELWRAGFGRFRGDGSDATCADGTDCWLQTRHGHSAREAAFGVPTPARSLVSSVERSTPRPRTSGALRWAAVAALTATVATDAVAAECPADAGFPEAFEVASYARHHGKGLLASSQWQRSKIDVLAGQPMDASRLPKLTAALSVDSAKPGVLVAALDEAEKDAIWDGWLVAQLWRRLDGADDDPETRALLARLERHARVVDTLTRTAAELGPVSYQPWMSKAGPPPGHQTYQIPKGFAGAAQERFASTSAGTWRSEVVLDVRVKGGRATLCRAGQQVEVDGALQLGRLDVLFLGPGARLEHTNLGVLATEGWVGPKTLGAVGAPLVTGRVAAALASNKPKDVDRVAAVLLLAAPAIRKAVEAQADAPGAPALRQLLSLYDQ